MYSPTVKSPVSEPNLPEGGSKPQYLFQLYLLRGAKISGGITDAPVLAAADIGITMDGGTDGVP
jgi:hypothetical protein